MPRGASVRRRRPRDLRRRSHELRQLRPAAARFPRRQLRPGDEERPRTSPTPARASATAGSAFCWRAPTTSCWCRSGTTWAATGLRDIDYNILTVLSMGDGRTIAELDKLVSISGFHVTEDDIARSIERGIVALDERRCESASCASPKPAAAMRSSCWPSRRRRRATRSATLDYREAQVLKLLLKRVIGSTASALPDHWRRTSSGGGTTCGATPVRRTPRDEAAEAARSRGKRSQRPLAASLASGSNTRSVAQKTRRSVQGETSMKAGYRSGPRRTAPVRWKFPAQCGTFVVRGQACCWSRTFFPSWTGRS